MSFFSLSCRYYACLCGHEALVDYLLRNGELKISDELCAWCDRGTYKSTLKSCNLHKAFTWTAHRLILFLNRNQQFFYSYRAVFLCTGFCCPAAAINAFVTAIPLKRWVPCFVTSSSLRFWFVTQVSRLSSNTFLEFKIIFYNENTMTLYSTSEPP